MKNLALIPIALLSLAVISTSCAGSADVAEQADAPAAVTEQTDTYPTDSEPPEEATTAALIKQTSVIKTTAASTTSVTESETTTETVVGPPPFAPEHADVMAAEVFYIVNAERQAAGLHALQWDDNFAYTAGIRVVEISDFFSVEHLRPDGSDWYTAIRQAGISYRIAGENIAFGGHTETGANWYTPLMVMNDWMNSPLHRDNILKTDFDYIGIAVYELNGLRYYVQHFGAY